MNALVQPPVAAPTAGLVIMSVVIPRFLLHLEAFLFACPSPAPHPTSFIVFIVQDVKFYTVEKFAVSLRIDSVNIYVTLKINPMRRSKGSTF